MNFLRLIMLTCNC
ncbi:MAG: hypothetical protein DRJ09_09330 [Bacteroidetes bacterium]|nr:MAG: hypothetical protein DRJ09_09330 [Bacteroidota bacterium]